MRNGKHEKTKEEIERKQWNQNTDKKTNKESKGKDETKAWVEETEEKDRVREEKGKGTNINTREGIKTIFKTTFILF